MIGKEISCTINGVIEIKPHGVNEKEKYDFTISNLTEPYLYFMVVSLSNADCSTFLPYCDIPDVSLHLLEGYSIESFV